MFRIPQRTSLVAQTRESLLDYLSQHQAGEALPGERQLCALLKVSRVTLRAALAELTREKIITGGAGRGRLIRQPPSRAAPSKRNVVFLAPGPLHQLEPRAILMFDELRERMDATDLHLDFVSQAAVYSRQPDEALSLLRSRLRPACWVLYRSTKAMQEWIVKQELPAVLIGTPHPGIRLPSVDVEYRASSRHAAAKLVAKGHRAIALLHPHSLLGGILESEQGFLEVAASGITASAIRHEGTRASLRLALDRLLAQPTAPTGFVVSRPMHALTALGHFTRRGLKVPGDIALIALEHDSFLDHTVPLMTHYYVDPVLFARKVSRHVLAVAGGGDTGYQIKRVMPTFVPGETVG